MASETGASTPAEEPTPAQLLMEQHDHHVTVEDVVDEEDVKHPPPSASNPDASDAPAATLSEKAAGKQKADDSAAPAPKPAKSALDTASEDAFPALGPVKPRAQASAPTWGKKPAAVTSNGVNGSNDASTPASGPALPTMSIPGQYNQNIRFSPNQLTPRKDLKKPINEIIREINRRSKAKLEMKQLGGMIVFESTGPVEAVRQSLKDIANEVGSKQSVDVPVPASIRAHIIGRQGSKIQEISKRTGARIQVPRAEAGEDEDTMVDVHIEGNALTAEMARREIEAIVNERTSTVNLRLKDIAAEYYPFLAGPRNVHLGNLTQGQDVDVKIPEYYTWRTQAPPQTGRNQPAVFVPQANFPIQISGERVAAQQVQAQLERRVQQLRQQLAVEQRSIERGRHQFIVGDHPGGSLHDFLEETGCSIVLPPSTDDSETVYIVGPPNKIEQGINKLEDLAASMTMATADCAREHRGPNSQAHAHNLTRYLRQRQALAELERQHEASIVAPTDRDGPTGWEIYARNGKNSMKARGDIMSVFQGHPPSRFATMDVDPFYHSFLQKRNAKQLRQDTGVHVVFPEEVEQSPELILVFEGSTPYGEYAIPRGAPPAAEVKAYQQALQQAQQFIQSLTSEQPEIESRGFESNPKLHRKIEQYINEEQQNLANDQVPVQALFGERRPEAHSRSNNNFAIRGPANAVDDFNAKILAFIEQAEKDELERNHVTTFDYPQKYASHLVGKGGENIQRLRQKFDVDVQIDDGKVTLKGPSAKAQLCKKDILDMAKKFDDEATHVLKIKPQYHRDLIGASGKQVERLQTRYNVRINFPRRQKENDDATSQAASGRNSRGQNQDEVIVRGPKKGADEARDELLNLLQYTMDNSHTDIVSVAQSQVPQLIGSGGREMENLRLATGCQIDVPGAREGADGSGRADIKLKGTKKQVEEAKKILQERAKVFDDTVVETIDVERKHHRTLIGGSGSNIRSIVTAAGGPDNSRDLARMVRFPKAESEGSSIRVEGPKSIVEKILASIKAQVSSLESQTTEILEVVPDKHRLLIGRGGETRRSLESQFNVQVDIPKQTVTGAARSQIKITGEPAQVEKAKEHILELVKGQEGETVQVPRYLHHVISDNGQFFRRMRSNHQITIDHDGQQPPAKPAQAEAGKARKGANGALPLITDDADNDADAHSWEIVDNNATEEGTDTSATIPWVLRGSPDSLPKARQTLEAAIQAASKPSSTGYLILPDPRSYRLVVGSGGSTINDLRKKTSTKINVPRDQAKNEAIEIVGSREGVEQAHQMILDIVSRSGNGRQ
ncbi:RNA binding effector protein-like protein Scp160 [Dothidotthia symphoricarpi CBS 119687]|uniref:RNA binding effector protein-like protein Scp160 n=1 Tax=Dothidotthia symphoricarpi CBS 119687 TaxID=1392245 RepID=A0A6A5ZXD5_9PLEO|nr:RNA binding effector protein-like protein Scp160 [Dothidotthia symphoricarpi CBS 119687]KAF2123936.1 RNA binding effector protein-like protein Scp160 [Dothidotthia symphoricarpi CBS 119687]